MKILSGAEIAAYMKENQAHTVRALISNKKRAKLVIIRNSENPVIKKYVELKQKYGNDIGVEVEDWLRKDVAEAITEASAGENFNSIIVQFPLENIHDVNKILEKIPPNRDVDGLATELLYHQMNNGKSVYSPGDIKFESATATAINWLLAGYDINLENLRIALVGRGRLVGAPLARMWENSGYNVTVFHRGDDLARLVDYDVIVSATGVARLIKNEMVAPGAVVVDAGTASEDGVLVGDVDDAVRGRSDLAAITPKVGGVGPLTIAALFEHVLQAAREE